MNIETRKKSLLARRAELTGQMRDIEEQLDAPASKDVEDRSSERQGDEVLEALGNVDAGEVRRIDLALQRIEDGTYGICAQCAEAISEERLAVVPATPLCKNCAA